MLEVVSLKYSPSNQTKKAWILNLTSQVAQILELLHQIAVLIAVRIDSNNKLRSHLKVHKVLLKVSVVLK